MVNVKNDNIEVDYEVLPPVFDMEEALVPGASEVHDGSKNISRNVTFTLYL